jgi:hypothetical protein
MHRVAGAPQRLRHAQAHGPQADQADLNCHGNTFIALQIKAD